MENTTPDSTPEWKPTHELVVGGKVTLRLRRNDENQTFVDETGRPYSRNGLENKGALRRVVDNG